MENEQVGLLMNAEAVVDSDHDKPRVRRQHGPVVGVAGTPLVALAVHEHQYRVPGHSVTYACCNVTMVPTQITRDASSMRAKRQPTAVHPMVGCAGRTLGLLCGGPRLPCRTVNVTIGPLSVGGRETRRFQCREHRGSGESPADDVVKSGVPKKATHTLRLGWISLTANTHLDYNSSKLFLHPLNTTPEHQRLRVSNSAYCRIQTHAENPREHPRSVNVVAFSPSRSRARLFSDRCRYFQIAPTDSREKSRREVLPRNCTKNREGIYTLDLLICILDRYPEWTTLQRQVHGRTETEQECNTVLVSRPRNPLKIPTPIGEQASARTRRQESDHIHASRVFSGVLGSKSQACSQLGGKTLCKVRLIATTIFLANPAVKQQCLHCCVSAWRLLTLAHVAMGDNSKVVFGGNLSFDHSAQEWSIFKERFESMCHANELTDDTDKAGTKRRSILLTTLVENTYRVARDLVSPKTLNTVEYKSLLEKLDDHFESPKCSFAERYKFYKAEQRPGEDLAEWAARVRRLAQFCGFTQELDTALRDRFVLGLENAREREKLFAESVDNLTFTKALHLAQATRSARLAMQATGPAARAAEAGAPATEVFAMRARRPTPPPPRAASYAPTNKCCAVCGFKNHSKDKCRYANYTCKQCNTKGHLSRVCKVNEKCNNFIAQESDDIHEVSDVITVNLCSKSCRSFVPNASGILNPLYELLKKDCKWNWREEQEAAFVRIKEELASDRVLAHYNPAYPTILTTDAGPALGAVLAQAQPDGRERVIAYASRSLTAKALTPITVSDICIETNKDSVLSRVKIYAEKGWPRKVKDSQLKPYFNCRVELTVEQGCILRGHKVVVPGVFREQLLNELHDSHQGVVKTKAEARKRMWWPKIDQQIEEKIGSCGVCMTMRSAPPRSPLAPWPYPAGPWQRVHLDMCAVQGKQFLIAVDAHSKWVECYAMAQTDSNSIIIKLADMFGRFGLARTLKLCSLHNRVLASPINDGRSLHCRHDLFTVGADASTGSAPVQDQDLSSNSSANENRRWRIMNKVPQPYKTTLLKKTVQPEVIPLQISPDTSFESITSLNSPVLERSIEVGENGEEQELPSEIGSAEDVTSAAAEPGPAPDGQEHADDRNQHSCVVDPNGGTDADVEARINRARAAYAQLKPVWTSHVITRRTKIRVFNSNVKSVLLYGCETWLVKKAITSKLQVFVNKCLRRILGVYWPRTITNTGLWELTSQKPIDKEILLRKWRVLRRPDAHLAKQALEWQAAGSRRPGRPRITWRRSVEKEISLIGYHWRDLEATAQDHRIWVKYTGNEDLVYIPICMDISLDCNPSTSKTPDCTTDHGNNPQAIEQAHTYKKRKIDTSLDCNPSTSKSKQATMEGSAQIFIFALLVSTDFCHELDILLWTCVLNIVVKN
ncbi:hypothetical protein MSG28_000703 [Choristoneura fumiferana]|uniref:Uncharacterized protein n=1 Tax=Choristoneura fumiferana TaxID=7141 RepID=A0ACC0K2E3_CHOFU|nr:hypothetical protein MSG28_000703 [Choristoneura fumiferana]